MAKGGRQQRLSPGSLAAAKVGANLIVESTSLDSAASRRLGEMGLRPGQPVSLCQRAGVGGLVVGLGPVRLALDQATARAISVTEASISQ